MKIKFFSPYIQRIIVLTVISDFAKCYNEFKPGIVPNATEFEMNEPHDYFLVINQYLLI